MNEFDEYQEETRRTMPKLTLSEALCMTALGLNGEAGEVAEMAKKKVFHGVAFSRSDLRKELGDTLWYLARVADENGISLSEVADANVAKLRARYPNGFVKGGGNRG